MPWSNQSGGGGWKGGSGGGGGGGPWGQGPRGGGGSGGGGQPPDLEEILKRGQDKMKQAMGGGSGVPGPLLFLAGAVAVAVVSWNAFFFRVNPDELGVVMRFGEYVRQEPPGLHFRYPYPIEEVVLPKVTQQRVTEIGLRSSSAGNRGLATGVTDVREESLMLTGDENIIDIDFAVFWRINNAKDYLFNIQNAENTVKEVAESAMREVVGKSRIQPILTEERQKLAQDVQKLVQDMLDRYKAGIAVTEVQLLKSDPPAEVIEAFRSVQAARLEKETLQNQASAYANKSVNEAKGEAERILQGAEGYKQQTVAEANGQANRFLQVYEEYRKAPDVTRQRMFLETMERVMGGTDKIILDGKGGQGVVPYLPLDQLRRTPPAAPATGGN